jgi:hypothetical protein
MLVFLIDLAVSLIIPFVYNFYSAVITAPADVANPLFKNAIFYCAYYYRPVCFNLFYHALLYI